MKKPVKKMAWIATFGMAYALFSVAFICLVWQLIFLQTCQKTKGVVIQMDRLPKIRSKDQFAPIIAFETANKEKITVHTKVYDYPPNFKTGDEVIVFYQTANPQNAKIQHFRHLWFWTSLWAGVGLCFLVVGFLSPHARGF